MRLVADVKGRDMQAGTGGNDRAENQDVAVAPGERPPRCTCSTSADGTVKYIHHSPNVGPVPATATSAASGSSPRFDHGAERGDRADHALAERDDRQQAVALRDMVGMPRGAVHAALGDDRARHLDHESAATKAKSDDGRVGENNSTTQPSCATPIVTT